ncbi:TPA: hypothetical protein ACH3X1_015792 [Trebouxia sp. C0004]
MAHEVELRASKVQAERVLEANNSLAENKIRVAANKIRVLEAAIRTALCCAAKAPGVTRGGRGAPGLTRGGGGRGAPGLTRGGAGHLA